MLAYSLPNHSHQDYVNADKKLNVEFDKLIADLTAAQLRDGQVSKPPAMIRDAERAGCSTAMRGCLCAGPVPQVFAESWLTAPARECAKQIGTAEGYQ